MKSDVRTAGRSTCGAKRMRILLASSLKKARRNSPATPIFQDFKLGQYPKIQPESSPHQRSVMPRKVDPLNKKLYCSVTTMLTVTDVKAAAAFYQKAFGFAKRGIMNGPDGKPIHAELTLRGTTLMLGPEVPQMGSRSAKR